jgi:hypothetical protein
MSTTKFTSPATAPVSDENKKIPPRVLDQVRRQLGVLAVITRARQTDERFAGRGRYEAEAYLHHKTSLDLAWQRLAEFERLCSAHGVEPKTVYTELGEPPQLSEGAQAWLDATSPAGPESSR